MMGTSVEPGRRRREWRAMVAAEVTSVLGDQLAKVGLSLVVFERTNSATLTGLTYALTLLPELVAGPVLSPVADRWPRRSVMVTCALAQAVLVGVMLIPGPLLLLAVAVAGVAALVAPFKAAQAAAVVEVQGADQRAGQSTLSIVRECGQLIGLGAAGAVVAVLGPNLALALDMLSFLAVATVIGTCVRARTIVHPEDHGTAGQLGWWAGMRSGWRVIGTDRRVLVLVLLVICVSGTVGPEAVIGPLITEMHQPRWTAGLLIAADSAGFVLTAAALRQAPVARQRALFGPLCLLSVAPLIVFLTGPGVFVAAGLLLLAGTGASYLALSRGEVMDLVPSHLAAGVAGVVRTGLRGGQGLAALGAGALAEITAPSTAVALTGATATLGVVAVLLLGRRHTTLRRAGGGSPPESSTTSGRTSAEPVRVDDHADPRGDELTAEAARATARESRGGHSDRSRAP